MEETFYKSKEVVINQLRTQLLKLALKAYEIGLVI